MKIFDAVTIFRELDMLELRMRLLWEYVDYFIIGEGKYTQAGQEKELSFHKHEDRFEWASEKIVYVLDETKYEDQADAERCPRVRLAQKALDMRESKEDILMLSDIDEIPDLKTMQALKEHRVSLPTSMVSDFYYYNVNCPRGKKWRGTTFMKLDGTAESLWSHMANKGALPAINGGWHFSYFMTNDEIRAKLAAFSHANEYNKAPYNTDEHLDKCRRENISFLPKTEKGGITHNPLPDYLMVELKRFPLFMGET